MIAGAILVAVTFIAAYFIASKCWNKATFIVDVAAVKRASDAEFATRRAGAFTRMKSQFPELDITDVYQLYSGK